jgi:hypothetical protein
MPAPTPALPSSSHHRQEGETCVTVVLH